MSGCVPAAAELVLHIGAPKTGSSAIQRHCQRNASSLEAAGCHYPPHPLDANGVSGGHGEIFNPLFGGRPDTTRDVLAARFADAREAGRRLLISAESIFSFAAEVVGILPTDAFHVVCLLRHPVDAIASQHNQGIKRHFGTEPLSQAVEAILSGEIVSRSLSGEVLLDWLGCCGRERMTVLPYIENRMPIDATARFLEVLGLPPAEAGPLVNRSYTPAAMALRRLVNSLERPIVAALDEDLDAVLQEYSDAHPAPRPTAADLLDAGQLAGLEAFFRDHVERLERAFGIRLERRGPGSAGSAPGGDSVEEVWRFLERHPPLAERLRAALATADESAPGRKDLASVLGPA